MRAVWTPLYQHRSQVLHRIELMRTVLICHEGADLDQIGLAQWMASFSDLAGIVVIRERSNRLWKRTRNEVRRSGWLRFFDVLAFRVYYNLFCAKQDRNWEADRLDQMTQDYPADLSQVPTLVTESPNSKAAEAFLRECRPDIAIARCKFLLTERIFSIPTDGTFVMHPGLCPEFRNSHGCFWALANGEPEKVAMTLLKIDAGVDTGPVYGYFTCRFDPQRTSHVEIQARTVLDNLPAIQSKLEAIHNGTAETLPTDGRSSGIWGQPWLTAYLRWRRLARRKRWAGSEAAGHLRSLAKKCERAVRERSMETAETETCAP